MIKGALSLFIGIVLSLSAFSQLIELPLLYSLRGEYYRQASINSDSIHLNYAPLYSDELSSFKQSPYIEIDTLSDAKWLERKLFYENFLVLNKKNIYLTLDPIFQFFCWNGSFG